MSNEDSGQSSKPWIRKVHWSDRPAMKGGVPRNKASVKAKVHRIMGKTHSTKWPRPAR